jgi:hypothetical protein
VTRADDAERHRVIEVLRAHLLDERLTMDEYAERVGTAWAATTLSELDALIADLPRLRGSTRKRRGRRHAEATAPDVGWRPTSECFIDPTTDRRMRVWVDPADGARHYVPD